MRKVLVGIVVLVIILLFGPLLAGVLLQRDYNKLLSFYNANGSVHIQLVDYKRHWLSSDVTLDVEIIDPDFRSILTSLGIETNTLPKTVKFTVNQHIQHGPIIYTQAEHLPSRFGLAAIHNTYLSSPEMGTFLKNLGANGSVIKTDDDMVTFFGNYFTHFSLADIRLMNTKTKALFQMKNAQANLWIAPDSYHIQGNIKLGDVKYSDRKDFFQMTDMQLSLDQHKSDQSLWMGISDWKIAKIEWKEKGNSPVTAFNINFTGHLDESDGKIKGDRILGVEKIEVEDEIFGPAQMKLSASKLNAKVIVDLMALYKEISRRGEFYQSELQQRLFAMLPSVILPGADIKLEKFNLATSEGDLHMNAGIKWPAENFTPSESLSELVDDGSAHANVKISKALADQLMEMMSESPYYRQIPPAKLHDLAEMEDGITLAMQQNAFLLAGLVDSGQMSDEDGSGLLQLIKKDPLGDEYSAKVKTFFLTKDVSLVSSYFLYWQQAAVQNQIREFEEQADNVQTSVLKDLHKEVDSWVKQGLVVETDKEYSVSVSRNKGVWTMNGKKVQQ